MKTVQKTVSKVLILAGNVKSGSESCESASKIQRVFRQPGRHQAGWFLCENRNVLVPEKSPINR